MVTVATGESTGPAASSFPKTIRIGAGPITFEICPSSHRFTEREKIGMVPALEQKTSSL
jgi:hypothetical protein